MKSKLFLICLIGSYAFLSSFAICNAQNALDLDGIDDFVSGTNNSSLDITEGTVEAWIKTDNAGSGWRAIVNKQLAYGIYLYGNNLALWDMQNWQAVYTTTNLADNNWHHIAFSFQDNVTNGTKIYADGVPILTTTIGVDISTINILVGASPSTLGGHTQQFNGAIDQVRVWNTARTDAEILENYQKCLIGNETGLVMLWDFEEGTGINVSDLTNNANNGVLTNMDSLTDWITGYDCEDHLIAYYPFNGNANDESGSDYHGTVYGATLTTDRNGNANSAYEFNGIDNYIDIGDWENGGPMSFTFWARWDAYHNYSRILDLGNGSSSNNIVVSQRQSNDELFFSIYLGTSETKMWTSTITQSQWDFYAATVDAIGIMTLYKNGQQIAQKTNGVTPNYLLRTQQFIGKSNFSQDGYFEGAIDELKIYNSALTEAQILNLFNSDTLGIMEEEENQKLNFYVLNKTIYFNEALSLAEINSISVYNLLGQRIYSSKSIERDIKLTFLDQGVYIITVDFRNGQKSNKKVIFH
jgi:hypothetical protein